MSISSQEGYRFGYRFGTREPLTICFSMGLFEILQGIAFGSSLLLQALGSNLQPETREFLTQKQAWGTSGHNLGGKGSYYTILGSKLKSFKSYMKWKGGSQIAPIY